MLVANFIDARPAQLSYPFFRFIHIITFSLQRVHHACLQRWIDERDLPRNSTGQALVCEICKTPYKSGYRAPPPRPEPSRMPRRIERVMVGQDLYVIVVDPQTGMATVRPTGGGLHDYEDSDEDDPRRLNMSPMSACIFSFFLFVMSSLLLSHLFTALPGPSVEPGSIPSPMDDEQADEQFQDLSMTLLLLWLMLRLLVLVAPVYTISRIFERARLARLRANSSAGESENDGVELRAVVVEAPPPSAGLAAVEVPPGRS